MGVVRYFHCANSGDLVSILAGIKHIYDTTGKKGVIYQRLNMPGLYYEGASHPLKDENGVQVTMTLQQWEMLVPLLKSQEYIEHCEVWEGQQFDKDLNKIREGYFTTMPHGNIARWTWYCDPALACNLANRWLSVPLNKEKEDIALINLTERYRNPLITYFFLKEWEDKIVFAGTEKEHELFCKQNKLKVPRLIVNNFLELAQAMVSCKFFLGNQSMCWNIAEALKIPRVLEVCRTAANCPPTGDFAYDFLHQGAVEFYVKRFFNNKT